MIRPTLFLMLGYPGAGKTTVARIIQELTGAVHVWADHERRERLKVPTYSREENLRLYSQLNAEVEELLRRGKSVIFDTNFKYAEDRQRLRDIADAAGAQTVVVWLTIAKHLARKRATMHDLSGEHTRRLGNMTIEDFERLANDLEEPGTHERVLLFDGKHTTEAMVAEALATL